MVPAIYQVNNVRTDEGFPILKRENLNVFVKNHPNLIPEDYFRKLNVNTSMSLKQEPHRLKVLNTCLFTLAKERALKGDYSLSAALEKALIEQEQIQMAQVNNNPPPKFGFKTRRPNPPHPVDINTIVPYQMTITTNLICCYSSIWMSKLSAWRNPSAQNTQQYRIVPILKKAITEVCLPFLTVTSAIETVAYTTLILGAKVLKPVSARPQNWVAQHRIPELNASSKFTFFWTTASLVHNIRERILPSDEWTARNRRFDTLSPKSI